LSVIFQYVSSNTDSYCARPNANTGINTLPPRYNVYVTIFNIFLYLSRFVSRIVVAYVVYVNTIFGHNRGAYAAPRCLSPYEL
jgi:hypothetical protein